MLLIDHPFNFYTNLSASWQFDCMLIVEPGFPPNSPDSPSMPRKDGSITFFVLFLVVPIFCLFPTSFILQVNGLRIHRLNPFSYSVFFQGKCWLAILPFANAVHRRPPLTLLQAQVPRNLLCDCDSFFSPLFRCTLSPGISHSQTEI